MPALVEAPGQPDARLDAEEFTAPADLAGPGSHEETVRRDGKFLEARALRLFEKSRSFGLAGASGLVVIWLVESSVHKTQAN